MPIRIMPEETNDLTTVEGVETLMKSSKDEQEWNANCDKVKAANGGYPGFWFPAIVMSGLMDRTLGAGASDIKLKTF